MATNYAARTIKEPLSRTYRRAAGLGTTDQYAAGDNGKALSSCDNGKTEASLSPKARADLK